MKKYKIHFFYLLIIAALAVASRLKTNEINGELMIQKALFEKQKAISDSLSVLLIEQTHNKEQ